MAILPLLGLKKLAAKRERRPKPPTQVTALDWDGRALYLAQTTTRGSRIVISRVASAPLKLPADAERSDPAPLGRALAQALDQMRVKPATVVLGIPRAQVVLRTLLLPVIDDVRELASVVHLQIGKDLPFRLADAVVDFKVNGQVAPAPARPAVDDKLPPPVTPVAAPAPRLEVVVAVAKREVVEFHQRVAEAAGLKLSALGLLAYANARCVEAAQLAREMPAFALVSLRPDEVSVDIVAGTTLPFSRGIAIKPPAEPDAAAREAFVASMTIEIVRTLRSYGGLGVQAELKKVFVTGATGQEPAVVSALRLQVAMPVEALEIAAPLELDAESRPHAPGATAAVGLALGLTDEAGLPFDFLNPKRPAVERNLTRMRIIAGLALAACLALVVGGLRAWLIGKRQKILATVQSEVVAAEKKLPIYKQMIQQAGVVNGWIKGDRDWLDHYAYLSAVLPSSDEIHLTSLTVSGQQVLRLAVQARSGEILAKVEKQLRAAGYDVKPLSITPGADRNGYEFRSTVELVVPDKLKIDLSKVKPPARPADDASLDPPVRKGGG